MNDNIGSSDYSQTIRLIASDIEGLKSSYPQLADFTAEVYCDVAGLVIDYAYKTHRAEGRPGWAGGVPNPDNDGVWFRIDFHDPDSMEQIHTQPVTEDLRYRDKKVSFLILQGSGTTDLGQSLDAILKKRGIRLKR